MTIPPNGNIEYGDHEDTQRIAAEYWESFKKLNSDPSVERQILEFLDSHKATFLDFYLANIFSSSPSFEYNLSCILLMKQTFSEGKLYSAPFKVWNILTNHVIYEYPDGILSLHRPNDICADGRIRTQFNNFTINGSKQYVARALARLSRLAVEDLRRLGEMSGVLDESDFDFSALERLLGP